ncbi:2-phosphosulfolactate phosphatase [Nocardioides cynanchi]|uniref:2-phosphosulfolactate phosphatase n=1 Tax=Nocardioides cynanchi TaxID=2558918 RepID=UPI001243B012|nr:2-phosphosulfolactate phosphatase [Nocardioides cynanchi]
MTHPEHGQASYRRRLEWGPTGAAALAADARPGDVAVVVDVLSFTTTLCVAVEQGIAVHPYPWAATDAASYAAARGAVLAVGRREGLRSGAVTLSPVSFAEARGVERVVLPSPNGSAISLGLADSGLTVVGACLRNASAVGRRLRDRPGRVSVVAAGERWPDGSLRPAVEDLWGAGAVLAALGLDGASPEAVAATAAFDAVRHGLAEALAACASGRELVTGGFAEDVAIAAAYDVSAVVPTLDGEAFRDAGRSGQDA